jgi:CubicO group peptidase (beta-lactamase class C family)
MTSLSFIRFLSLFFAAATALGAQFAIADFNLSMPEKQGVSGAQLERLSQLSELYVEQGRVPGIVHLVLRNGEIIHYEAVGQRGANDSTPMKRDDLFRIYSMTKPITSVAAMQLYEQGKFQLSDPVTKFVPELKNLSVLNEDGTTSPSERTMTMHQLLMHTAGFSYGFHPLRDPIDKLYLAADLQKSTDLDAFASNLAALPLRSEPGEVYHYSVAVDITGLIVQRLSGLPLDEYIDRHILKPLQMNDTFFEVPSDKRHRFVQITL